MFVAAKLFHKAGEGSGGGGSDPHNLGYYADLTALQTAYPTGTDGDFAILGSTDTIWVWDSGTSAWKDTDTKGQVTSVNNQTGTVTLGINDVAPTQTGKSGYVLGTDGFVAGWVKPEIVQVSALPTASADEVDNIYQFVGTTDANYTNGYFYKCVSDGQNPATYSWTQTDVQPAPSGLPDQTGQSGKFLTTDGTDASWATINALQNTATGADALTLLGTPATLAYSINIGDGSSITGSDSYNSVVIGRNASASCSSSVVLGVSAQAIGGSFVNEMVVMGDYSKGRAAYAVAVGSNSDARGRLSTAIGAYAITDAEKAIQLGEGTNSTTNTLSVGLSSNYRLLEADGTIPHGRLTNALASTSVTIATTDWSSNTASVTVSGLTATSVVIVAPDNASQSDYTSAGVYASAQAADTLTFTCASTPASSLTINVVYC